MFFQSQVVEKIFQNLHVRLKFRIRLAVKIKFCVALKLQYFELRIFYVTRGFIASTRAFSLLTRVFNLPTRAFNLATRSVSLVNCGFELATSEFELVAPVLLFHISFHYFYWFTILFISFPSTTNIFRPTPG